MKRERERHEEREWMKRIQYGEYSVWSTKGAVYEVGLQHRVETCIASCLPASYHHQYYYYYYYNSTQSNCLSQTLFSLLFLSFSSFSHHTHTLSCLSLSDSPIEDPSPACQSIQCFSNDFYYRPWAATICFSFSSLFSGPNSVNSSFFFFFLFFSSFFF